MMCSSKNLLYFFSMTATIEKRQNVACAICPVPGCEEEFSKIGCPTCNRTTAWQFVKNSVTNAGVGIVVKCMICSQVISVLMCMHNGVVRLWIDKMRPAAPRTRVDIEKDIQTTYTQYSADCARIEEEKKRAEKEAEEKFHAQMKLLREEKKTLDPTPALCPHCHRDKDECQPQRKEKPAAPALAPDLMAASICLPPDYKI